MKKFIAATAALTTLALSAPAFAATVDNEASLSTSVTASQLACITAAVDVREAAVINARTMFHASIMAALNTRKTSLKAAFSLTDATARRAAIKASWDAFIKASADARATYKADVKAAWSAYATASNTCVGTTGNTGSSSSEDNDDDKEHTNNGRHLGQLKKQAKKWLKPDLKFEGNVKLDASL